MRRLAQPHLQFPLVTTDREKMHGRNASEAQFRRRQNRTHRQRVRGEAEVKLGLGATQREGPDHRIFRSIHEEQPRESADEVGVLEIELRGTP